MFTNLKLPNIENKYRERQLPHSNKLTDGNTNKIFIATYQVGKFGNSDYVRIFFK
jgi:hypothetical protein